MQNSRFPLHRDLAGSVLLVTAVDQVLIKQLADRSFTDRVHNAVLIGGPGTGKAHSAIALGVAGITLRGRRVRFYSTADLVNALKQEKAQGRAGRLAAMLLNMDFVILDELGY